MELADLYRRSVESWTARLDTIPDDQWGAPTPCTEWTVRDLVNHVTGEDAWTVPLMRGSTIAEVGDSLDGDLLGDEPVDTAVRSAKEALDVVAEKLPEGGTVHLSFGETDSSEYIWQLTTDHLIHAWDLAAATGGDRTFDAELIDEVSRWWAEREELYRQGGAIGPRVEAADDPQSQLLGSSGRDPEWMPPRQ